MKEEGSYGYATKINVGNPEAVAPAGSPRNAEDNEQHYMCPEEATKLRTSRATLGRSFEGQSSTVANRNAFAAVREAQQGKDGKSVESTKQKEKIESPPT